MREIRCFKSWDNAEGVDVANGAHDIDDNAYDIFKFYIDNFLDKFPDLGLQEDQSVEYGIKQCQEMSVLLHRLVVDGKWIEIDEINTKSSGNAIWKTQITLVSSKVNLAIIPNLFLNKWKTKCRALVVVRNWNENGEVGQWIRSCKAELTTKIDDAKPNKHF